MQDLCSSLYSDELHCVQPKGRAAVVKDEPLSPDVKSEPESSPQKPARSKPVKVKKAEGEKRVIVKKEFDMPGQTRDTPSEVSIAVIL